MGHHQNDQLCVMRIPGGGKREKGPKNTIQRNNNRKFP